MQANPAPRERESERERKGGSEERRAAVEERRVFKQRQASSDTWSGDAADVSNSDA